MTPTNPNACQGFDNQCANAWCNCNAYKQAAEQSQGHVPTVMTVMQCSSATAQRVCDWYAQQQTNKTTCSVTGVELKQTQHPECPTCHERKLVCACLRDEEAEKLAQLAQWLP